MVRHLLKIYPLEFGRHFTGDEVSKICSQLLNEDGISVVPESIKIQQFDEIRFVSCGNNLHRVKCPLCGKQVEMGTWQDLLNTACSRPGGYDPTESHALPCGHSFPLHSLGYKEKCGFASAVISVQPVSHTWMGWLREFPWIDFVAATYDE